MASGVIYIIPKEKHRLRSARFRTSRSRVSYRRIDWFKPVKPAFREGRMISEPVPSGG